MALISNLLPLNNEDVVGVFRLDGGRLDQLYVGQPVASDTFGFALPLGLSPRGKLNIVRVTAIRETRGFEHPLENSTTLIDNRIVLPNVVEIEGIITNDPNGSIYAALNETYQNADDVIIKTKAGEFRNLYLASLTHDETVSRFNALTVNLTFREIQQSTGDIGLGIGFLPRSAENQTSRSKGLVIAERVASGVASVGIATAGLL